MAGKKEKDAQKNGEDAEKSEKEQSGQEFTQAQQERTFTQAQLDAIIGDRLRDERKKYADYDEVTAELARLREANEKRKEAELSEIEKLEKRLARAQSEKAQAEQRQQDSLIRMAIEREAAKANFHDPGEAYALADLTEVEITDGGGVAGVEEAVQALAEARPHLIKRADKPDIDADKGGDGKPDRESEAYRESIKRRFGL